MSRFVRLLVGLCGIVAGAQPLAAQQALPIVGVLSSASADFLNGEQFTAFRRGLAEAGLAENRNVKVEYRWANNDYRRLPALANELVRLNVSVIVAAGGHVSAIAAHEATKSVPIVFTTVTDPVKSGLVESLNKPGGNLTGTAGLTSELDPKRLELLHELKPAARVFGVLANPARPEVEIQLQDMSEAANKLGVKLEFAMAPNEAAIDRAFETFAQKKIDALIVTADPLFNSFRQKLVGLSAKLAVPSIYQWREFVQTGGLISYGPSITDAYRQAGIYAVRIVKGEKVADLPVMRPTRFEMVINNKTAKSLGLVVPASLLARADDVIE
jgi:putative ABC transport system substrate-binding protein